MNRRSLLIIGLVLIVLCLFIVFYFYQKIIYTPQVSKYEPAKVEEPIPEKPIVEEPVKVEKPIKPRKHIRPKEHVKVEEPAKVEEPIPEEPVKVKELLKIEELAKPEEPVKVEEPAKVEEPVKVAKPAKVEEPIVEEPAEIKEVAEFKERIALFTFVNFSDDSNALTQVMPVLREKLESMGFEVVDELVMERFLLKERIRSTAYIIKEVAEKVDEELGASAILLGAINLFSAEGNLKFGLSARLVDSSDGRILWADHVSATSGDYSRILGLDKAKTIDKLVSRVIDKLLASFNTSPPYLPPESVYRIAVMPFENRSDKKFAGMITTYLFMVKLFKSYGFVVVEFGEVRKSVVNLRIRDRGQLDYNSTKKLSEALQVDGILVGTVELFNEGMDMSPPEVAINARLINARKSRVIWYDRLQLNGNDGIIVFDWGKIKSVDSLAYKVVSRLTDRMEKTEWR